MPTTYEEAPGDVTELMDEAIEEYFPDIRRCDPAPRISVLMAANEDGPPLKKWGGVCAAMIKKSSKEDKAEGGPDLRILIDGGRWDRSDRRGRLALLCHELFHVEVQWEDGGRVPKLDDYGRPKIKLRPDDWVLTGFLKVAEWFGDDALEIRALRSVESSLRQLTLPFPDGQAAVSRRVAEIEREEAGGGDVVRDAFAALLSVGHTEQQARAAIDGVLESGRTFRSVASLIDAVYEAAREPALAS